MTFLGQIIELLQSEDWSGTEAIDIAKGKHAIPENWNEFIKAIKWQSHRNNNHVKVMHRVTSKKPLRTSKAR